MSEIVDMKGNVLQVDGVEVDGTPLVGVAPDAEDVVVDDGAFAVITGTDAQAAFEAIDAIFDGVPAALAGTLTGSADGTIADVAAVSTAGGNTYADSAINTAITSINLQLKELQTKLNAVIAALS